MHLNGQGLRSTASLHLGDSLPQTRDVVVVIPFEYKQSSLYFPSTFKLMDSVAMLLTDNDSISLRIAGYSYLDEGNDNICFWLSYNRALAVKTYILGRGVDSARLVNMEARSKERSVIRRKKNEPVNFNCTAEIILQYPIPPPPTLAQDADGDGFLDEADGCPNAYGYAWSHGCPDSNAIIVPFEPGQAALFSNTYLVLDSLVSELRLHPAWNLRINGHAHMIEAVETVCDQLAGDRADIVKRYFLTRQIDGQRITGIENKGVSKPLNAARNPREKAANSRVEIYLEKN